MEGVSATIYRGIRRYWKKRGYVRLNGSSRRRKNQVQLGEGKKSRRTWRIKISPKLKLFRLESPKKVLVWLRDKYINLMMRFAGSGMLSSGYGGMIDDGICGFGSRPLKEYDNKMIIEIYKSLVIAQGLMPQDAVKIGSQIVCSRR